MVLAKRVTNETFSIPGILIVLSVLIAGAGCTDALAESQNAKALKAFDALCISTFLKRNLFSRQAETYQHKSLPKRVVQRMSPNNEFGYSLLFENLPAIAVFGTARLPNGKRSERCTITVTQISFSDATALIETNFPVRVVEKFKQGASELATYSGVLAGYNSDMAISVQVGEGMATFGLFDMPK